LHHCDNPSCVNPSHLWLGTVADNMADRDRKGRATRNRSRGEKHGHHKLTREQVKAIRRRYAKGGISQRELADEYKTCQSTIGYIILRRTWKHI
jgi:hypothetical protein